MSTLIRYAMGTLSPVSPPPSRGQPYPGPGKYQPLALAVAGCHGPLPMLRDRAALSPGSCESQSRRPRPPAAASGSLLPAAPCPGVPAPRHSAFLHDAPQPNHNGELRHSSPPGRRRGALTRITTSLDTENMSGPGPSGFDNYGARVVAASAIKLELFERAVKCQLPPDRTH